jgi:hypothetical protein
MPSLIWMDRMILVDDWFSLSPESISNSESRSRSKRERPKRLSFFHVAQTSCLRTLPKLFVWKYWIRIERCADRMSTLHHCGLFVAFLTSWSAPPCAIIGSISTGSLGIFLERLSAPDLSSWNRPYIPVSFNFIWISNDVKASLIQKNVEPRVAGL